jgi:hypothetical protein
MKTFSSFEKLCLKRLKILETTFGFRVKKIERESYGVFVTYQNSTTFVRLSFAPREGGIFVSLGHLVAGHIPPYDDMTSNWFDFHDLLGLRAPRVSFRSGERPTDKKIDMTLKDIAGGLKTYAPDVLAGDFAVFRDLDKLVRQRRKYLAKGKGK